MPDLLAHVLVVYAGATIVSWYSDRVPRRLVPVAMAGAGIPDLSKLRLLLDSDRIEAVAGVPFTWGGLHRLGPALLVAALVTLAFRRGERRGVFASLAAGVIVHLVLDLGVVRAAGVAPPYWYPVTWWQPPAMDLFLSSDSWPTLVAIFVAAVVFALDRRGRAASPNSSVTE